jgi:uncharacterized protein YmfQ (DUF2313 family)
MAEEKAPFNKRTPGRQKKKTLEKWERKIRLSNCFHVKGSHKKSREKCAMKKGSRQ